MLPPDLEFGGPCGRHLGSLAGEKPVKQEADLGLAFSVIQKEADHYSGVSRITEAAGRGWPAFRGAGRGLR